MNKHYLQLTQEPRYQISALRKTGMSLRKIAEEVGIHYSSVCPELRRNSTEAGYDPLVAQQLSDKSRRTAHKADKRQKATDKIISDGLMLGWSPEAIHKRIEVENPHLSLSHTTIYRRIEEDKQQGGQLYSKLPRYGKRRWKGGKRGHNSGVKHIPNRVDISERPAIVETRERLGDWEGDTVYELAPITQSWPLPLLLWFC